MKTLLFLLVTLLLAAPSAFSQTRKAAKSKSKRPPREERSIKIVDPPVATDDVPPPPAPKPLGKERLSSDVFKDAAIDKWGVAGLSLPDDLTNESESSEPQRGKNVSWIDYSRTWKQAAIYYPSALEVDLTVTTWDADFKTIVPELRPELATPENMLLMDLAGDERNKNTPGSVIKESRRMTVGGVEGGYFLADSPSNKNRFLAGWSTYRYFEGKAQRISLTVTGRKDELPKAMKIIQSLMLAEAKQFI